MSGWGRHEDPRAMRLLPERRNAGQCDLVRVQGWYREGMATFWGRGGGGLEDARPVRLLRVRKEERRKKGMGIFR